MRPKFEVGEVVLLESKMFPKYNGEYVVTSVKEPGMRTRCLRGGPVHYKSAEYTYGLGFEYEYEGGVLDAWREQSLRKKHQPGEMSFDSLMASLSSPKLLQHKPEGVGHVH